MQILGSEIFSVMAQDGLFIVIFEGKIAAQFTNSSSLLIIQQEIWFVEYCNVITMLHQQHL